MKRNNKQKKLLTRLPFSVLFWTIFTIVMITLFFCNRVAISKTVTKLQDKPIQQEHKNIAKEVQDIVEKKVRKNEDNSTFPNINTQEQKTEGTSEVKTDIDAEKKENNTEGIPQIDVKQHEKVSSSYDDNANDFEIENSKQESGKLNHAQDEDATQNARQEIEERQIEVYFATVSDSGVVSREKCIRTIAKSSSPMVDSINALLAGPTKDEAKRGLRSFVPVETRLLSASIKDGSALLNFSEEFQFNRYGVEGYNVQLQQVVFTACSFPTVNSVQFLIEGQKRDFIGSEGVWIGSPFTTSSF